MPIWYGTHSLGDLRSPYSEKFPSSLNCNNKIAVVHNGIIENYQQLRKELTERVIFLPLILITEVIPHLIEESIAQGMDLKDAVWDAIKYLTGAYGVVVMHADTPDYMVVARKESPLTIGIIPDETCFAASDIPAFLPLTRQALVLEDDEMALLYAGHVEVYDVKTGEPREREPIEIQWSIDAAEKVLDGIEYKWFMGKELHEVPRKIKDQIRIPQENLDAFAETISNADHVYITAAGTADYARV